jgi:hypothetical protein
VNVADEREKVRRFLNEKRLVSPLEEVSNSVVALVEPLSIGAMKRQHDSRQRDRPRFESKMHVVRHQAVGVETKTESISIVCESSEVEISIGVVSEDIALFVSTRNDVIHRPREFQARGARHQQIRGLN